VRVLDIIASHLYRGFSPDELTVQFNLSLAQVYAALAFYYSHTDEFNQVMREETKQADASRTSDRGASTLDTRCHNQSLHTAANFCRWFRTRLHCR
jgi:hypothetical protein